MSSVPDQSAAPSLRDGRGSELGGSSGVRRVSVEEGYERWAATYDTGPNPLLRLEERQLRRMLPRLEGRRVLDLACGTGRWLDWMLSQGACLGVGVDFSPAMLAVAKQKPALRHRLVRADCRAIPLASARFDLVILSFAVGHFRTLARVAGEVGRVAAPGADLYVSDLHPLAYNQGWQTRFRDESGIVEISTWPRTTAELLAPWAAAGFECTQMVECRFSKPERQVFSSAGKDHLFETYCSVPAVLACHFIR